jgi:lysophospholipase L1-like esterase
MPEERAVSAAILRAIGLRLAHYGAMAGSAATNASRQGLGSCSPWICAALFAASFTVGCRSSGDQTAAGAGGTLSPGSGGSGGSASAPASGGGSGAGGSRSGGASGSGGDTQPGKTGGSTGSGGLATGGTSNSGGSIASGGVSAGGAGGSRTGGTVGSGGTATGGRTTGGTSGTGGVATGGAGGSRVSGSGGRGTGGVATGGAGAGGRATGGAVGSGGVGTGGAATGGALGSGGGTGKTDAGTAYRPCPTDGSACKIMPFGDSITDGYGVAGGYRVELFRRAHQAGKNITFVGSGSNGPAQVDGVAFPPKHEGHSGFTIDKTPSRSGIAPLVGTVMPTYTPHVVTLMIGTNDAIDSYEMANAPTRLGALIDSIFAQLPQVLLVVAQPIPSQDDALNQRLQTYNAAIPAVVKTRADAGKHILLVDMYAVLAADPSYKTSLLQDTWHPNQAGHNLLGARWYEVLAGSL